ncbi:hypothetical protein N0V93_008306 [Gnomoniopsis smithogilvyi]|uniref:Uncharacterized protein n=1 Tax=Gnomoniopsis smithogilvyi TaxID=1191159 RepID=A0A9W9CUM7_9PEZI|nr:hypothetical protein N0V93_008306 [Gnomoniopsis smithogilvyi]
MGTASPVLTFPPGLRLSSPPHTPTAPSPPPFFAPKISAGPGAGPEQFSPPIPPASLSQSPSTPPFSNVRINYSQPLRPQEISPCSSNSSEADFSEPESVSSDDDREPGSSSPPPDYRDFHNTQVDSHPIVTIRANFTIEELSDFGEDDMRGRSDIIYPFAIEDPESERPVDILDRLPKDLENLQCCSPHPETSSDDSDLDEDAHQAILQRIRDRNRRMRMSQSSVGTKRTMSERGSDSDHDDVRNYIGFEEAGSSARRLKRRIGGDRRSLIFQDPPPRIDEVVEPEELEEALARELPFYEYTSMEVDSPRSP